MFIILDRNGRNISGCKNHSGARSHHLINGITFWMLILVSLLIFLVLPFLPYSKKKIFDFRRRKKLCMHSACTHKHFVQSISIFRPKIQAFQFLSKLIQSFLPFLVQLERNFFFVHHFLCTAFVTCFCCSFLSRPFCHFVYCTKFSNVYSIVFIWTKNIFANIVTFLIHLCCHFDSLIFTSTLEQNEMFTIQMRFQPFREFFFSRIFCAVIACIWRKVIVSTFLYVLVGFVHACISYEMKTRFCSTLKIPFCTMWRN